ncbi:iminophenyl-pyruvate dimer synthase VioB [Chromobacterium sp. IIBBL 290-4]|uniref:iminophenyl-pyruvate dimer synthase VioB n=1 Tax=Chromobacterium sp. IIBBL 290-4 TaxID=2953890 RepID=UPI0020B8F2FA|nr:iminophenyl-pyruvate dimer synthase VioB [Chromobacterium sp. IIBBL 290-4]UTH74305.1 iminophenyl-pyruvate dimer synthase VioB [Chromobacterium sp. IIBBL 290-4]
MSVLDFPRVHFGGWARVNAPTANRNSHGAIDMASNTVSLNGAPVDPSFPPEAFQQALHAQGVRYGLDGKPNPDGPFSSAMGYNAGGNNHFSWEGVTVSAVELADGGRDASDPLVGARLALWGHYNEYLRTTFNRARWVDCDPEQRDAVSIYAGQFAISPAGASAETPLLFTADIERPHAARWTTEGHIHERGGHFLDDEIGLARLFQFSIGKNEPHFLFHADAARSSALARLQAALADEDVLGLTVQYVLFNMSTPPQPNSAVFHQLSGAIGLWRRDELASYPAGRVLRPQGKGLGPLALRVGEGRVSFNMAAALPFATRSPAPMPDAPGHALGGKLPLGDLELQDENGKLVARIPQTLYLDYAGNQGIFDRPLLARPEGALKLVGALAQWREQEWVSQTDADNLYLEAPDRRQGLSFPRRVSIRSFYRGERRPRPSLSHRLRGQGLVGIEARTRDGDIEWLIAGKTPGPGRIELDDGMECLRFRVLPDDWALDAATAEQVDYAFLYRHVMMYYELIYPFMSDKVFSLADRCKCETYARLMWQMCDPQNRDKSYYMPSTRELSAPKARLFLKYLEHVEGGAKRLQTRQAEPRAIADKAGLIAALETAVDLELSVMLQYLYAAYSIPNFAQGEQRAEAGEWTPEQLALACGSGDRRRDGGIRAALLEIAHEEMIHYLVVNNVLMALGEPFRPGVARMGEEARLAFGLDTEFACEPFSEAALSRFIRLEWPGFLPSPGRNIADFYAGIRQALQTLPELFEDAAGKLGGEHHLFLSELVNRAHPAYQLEVSDRDSALFGIAFVTDQGEGGSLDSPHYPHSHFQRLRDLSSRLAAQPQPFEPGLPALKNPALEAGAGLSRVEDGEARALMRLYLGVYELMAAMMAQHFAVKPLASLRRSRLMNGAIDLMTGLLRPVSCALMNMPSGEAGRTAGPPLPGAARPRSYEDYSLGCAALAKRCQALAKEADGLAETTLPAAPRELLHFYHKHLLDLASGKLTREA